jgi:hypothetical protein
MRPLLLLSLSHLDFPRSNLPLPLPALSPCGALGFGDGNHRNLDPEVNSLPSSLSLSSLPLPLSSPLRPSGFSLPARALPAGAAPVARPPDARPQPPSRGRLGPVVRRPTLGLVSFKFSLMSVLSRTLRRVTIQFKFEFINVLRRALRHATIQFKFVFINVLRRALHRATIHFKFVFIKVRCRALRRAMIRFKFSSVDVSRRAFRRATLNVCL